MSQNSGGGSDIKIYVIKSIKDLNGKERKDGIYPLRIGRSCTIEAELGKPMYAQYKPREGETGYRGTLVTSPVDMIADTGNELIIQTQHSVYILEEEKGNVRE